MRMQVNPHTQSAIIFLNSGKVAKIKDPNAMRKGHFRGLPGISSSLEQEADMQARLHDIGLPFPQPYGIHHISVPLSPDLPNYVQSRQPALIMDRIDNVIAIPSKDITEVLRQANDALALAHNHGLRPYDDNPENLLWNPSTKRVHFVDAELWRENPWGIVAAYTEEMLKTNQRYQTSRS